MARLYTDSLCSYSGRSDRHAGILVNEKYQRGNWSINPGYIKPPSIDVSETGGTHMRNSCGFTGNCKIDWSEVSRGHSSQGVGVMAGARRRTEHFTRGSLSYPGQLALKGETTLE